MFSIFADALFIATRFGPQPGDEKRRPRQSELDYGRASERDQRDWEAQRRKPFGDGPAR